MDIQQSNRRRKHRSRPRKRPATHPPRVFLESNATQSPDRRTATVNEGEETEGEPLFCVICLEIFDAKMPPVCLPCSIANGTMSRHCVLCRNCLMILITKSDETEAQIFCPVCREPFDKKQVYDALKKPLSRIPSKRDAGVPLQKMGRG